ncbi:Signal recognition particle receptor subunit beta [Auxenochlorella protothecoides]|uniref:Signal recognition particle receptor subunit beta n=1 Tax=Auxenochlorella protothecoides TaxID=3075 RepID=A0A087SDU0_AUXPR|nr:Signal recognition particle receptor subunit beta [Auxenochlorella protothecoides]KFM23894.1 Signal recognition particle receptor subunit beta [Auxenochlorella protothecoides]
MEEAWHSLFGSGVQPFHIAFTILAVIGLIFIISVARSRPNGRNILILGPTGSGKTTLFHRLQYGSTLNGTVASMEPREVTTNLASDKASARASSPPPAELLSPQSPAARPVNLVDIPGHPRVRDTWLAWEKSAQGIVFLVDAVDFLPHKSAIAEQLYDVLTHPSVVGRRLPILLVCNKSDMGVKAHSVDFIRKRLEKELDLLQTTRSALEDVGGGRAASTRLLPPGAQAFTLAALQAATGIEVGTASASAQEGDGVGLVEAFVRRCAPA